MTNTPASTPPTMPTTSGTTLVLLDPTSDDGESALTLLDETDEQVMLLVLLSGPASRSLREFAHAEEIDLSTAGWQYLEQVVQRLTIPADQLMAMTASGPSAATELADVAATNDVHRVLLPSSVERLEPGLAGLLARCVAAPTLTATAYAQVG